MNEKELNSEYQKEPEIVVSYKRDGIAPLELWDTLPDTITNGKGYETVIDLLNTVAESDQLMAQLPKHLATIIHELQGVNILGGEQLQRIIDFDDRGPKTMTIDPRKVADAMFCHQLLFALTNLGYTDRDRQDPSVAELVQQLYRDISDDVLFRISDLRINGRSLPNKDGAYLVGGAKKWKKITRIFSETGEEKSILFVPDPESESILEHISQASQLIAGAHPVDFIVPQESYDDLMWSILDDDGKDPSLLFANIERYGTVIYESLFKISMFIRWAQEEESTQILAERLTAEYIKMVEAEKKNLSQQYFSDRSPLAYLEGHPLPTFEIPHKLGRATGHLYLDEHVQSVQASPHARVQTLGELSAHFQAVLLRPLLDLYPDEDQYE